VKAAHDPALDQALDARVAGRRGQAHPRGELLVRQPGILLQEGQQGVVDSVEGAIEGLHTKKLRSQSHPTELMIVRQVN
jgi:hypothetical protein